MKEYKIIISGLDNAGKTSLLKAFNKRYDFQKEILDIKPTRKVEYHHTTFLENSIVFWDMGGQETYRVDYESNPDLYFDETDLLIYVIDIQDNSRFDDSIAYLNRVLKYFEDNSIDIPLIVAFHKFDPELRGNEEIINNASKLTGKIIKIEQLKLLFLQTSIYDVHSIVQLISSSLSLFDDMFSDLEALLKMYLTDINCKSLIIFDKNGIIVSEYYTDSMNYDLYTQLLDSIKDQIINLKKIQEDKMETKALFNQLDNQLLSYLHKVEFKNIPFYISAIIEEENKEVLLNKFPIFITEMNSVLTPIFN